MGPRRTSGEGKGKGEATLRAERRGKMASKRVPGGNGGPRIGDWVAVICLAGDGLWSFEVGKTEHIPRFTKKKRVLLGVGGKHASRKIAQKGWQAIGTIRLIPSYRNQWIK